MLAVIPEFLIPVFTLLLFAATFTTIYTIKSRRDTQRKKALEALASTLETSFTEKDAFGLARQLNQFDLFKRERNRLFRNGKITNVQRSTVGETEVFLFDYSYVISTGKSARRVSQTVFFANDKKWFLPNFRLKPENWWHKILRGIGADRDINFEENTAFSEKFWLKSEFEDVVRQQFTPELQQFMMEKPPVHLEGNNYYLLAYKPGKLLAPEDTQHFFENCCALTRLLQTEGKVELLELVEIKQAEALKRGA
jgi:hypothetical protein